MREPQYNPDDPLFLLSRSLDEDLPEPERSAEGGLDKALAASASLRAEAEELRALDRLIMRWAGQPAELDWEHHAALIIAQAEGNEDADGLEKVDRLLEHWGRRSVSLHAEAFTADVMAKVAPKRGRIIWSSPLFRLVRLRALAAAAAVVLAVTGVLWFTQSPEPFVYVAYEPQAATRAGSSRTEGVPRGAGRTSRVVVSFARTPVYEEAPSWAESGISFGSLGSTVEHTWTGEIPPI